MARRARNHVTMGTRRRPNLRAWVLLTLALVPIAGTGAAAAAFWYDEGQRVTAAENETASATLVIRVQLANQAFADAYNKIIAAADTRPDSDLRPMAERARLRALNALPLARQSLGDLAATDGGNALIQDLGLEPSVTRVLDAMTVSLGQQVVGRPLSEQMQRAREEGVAAISSTWFFASGIDAMSGGSSGGVLVGMMQYATLLSRDQRELLEAIDDPEALRKVVPVKLEDEQRIDAWRDLAVRVRIAASDPPASFDFGRDLPGDPAVEILRSVETWLLNNADFDVVPATQQRAWIASMFKLTNQLTTSIDETYDRRGEQSSSTLLRPTDRRVVGTGVASVLGALAIGLFALTRQEISHRRKVEDAHADAIAKLDYEVTRDPLTGVWNRRRLSRALETVLEHPEDGMAVVLVYLDLDGFKAINDVWGHSTGDKILQVVAMRLSRFQHRRQHFDVVRFGGDEFICFTQLPRPTIAETSDIGSALIASIQRPITIGERHHEVTATAGLAVSDLDSTTTSLLLEADSSLILAKRNQRGTAAVYNRLTSRTVELVAALPAALRNGEIYCHVQPAYNLITGKLSHVEALARWRRGNGETVTPSEFVPLTEGYGLASALTSTVLSEVARMQAIYDCKVWVNVSPIELSVNDFVRRITDDLRRAALDPSRLGIEITETGAVGDPVRFASQLSELRALGVSTAIDDFGSGYSPLGYLRDLPVEMLKLDRSLITRIDCDTTNQHIIQGAVAVARQLGMSVTAEGIERPEELAWLRENGVDNAQGYLLAVPAAPIPGPNETIDVQTLIGI